jgi:hypothetical protein
VLSFEFSQLGNTVPPNDSIVVYWLVTVPAQQKEVFSLTTFLCSQFGIAPRRIRSPTDVVGEFSNRHFLAKIIIRQ